MSATGQYQLVSVAAQIARKPLGLVLICPEARAKRPEFAQDHGPVGQVSQAGVGLFARAAAGDVKHSPRGDNHDQWLSATCSCRDGGSACSLLYHGACAFG